MTFDFRSVPRGGKLAVTFFPGLVEPSLQHFLEEQGITGWSIVSKKEALYSFQSAIMQRPELLNWRMLWQMRTVRES